MPELKAIPMMDCELLPSMEINRVISKVTPFNRYDFNEDHILVYLNNVNGILKRKRSDEIRDHYIVVSSIYSFVKPLLGLKKADELENTFVKIVQGNPYELTNPLDLVFTGPEGKATMDVVNIDVETIASENMEQSITIKSGNILKKRIRMELDKNFRIMTEKMYDKILHFSFVGYLDVCQELFLNEKKSGVHIEYDNYLKNEKGSFNIMMPCCL